MVQYSNQVLTERKVYSYQGIPAGGLEEFKKYFNAELPALLSREIEAELGEEMGPVVQRLKQKLPDLIRRCSIRLCREYPPSATPLPRAAQSTLGFSVHKGDHISSAFSSESQVYVNPTENNAVASPHEIHESDHDNEWVGQLLGQADFTASHQNPTASGSFEIGEEGNIDFDWPQIDERNSDSEVIVGFADPDVFIDTSSMTDEQVVNFLQEQDIASIANTLNN